MALIDDVVGPSQEALEQAGKTPHCAFFFHRAFAAREADARR